jgi:hypothetical protein
VHCLRFQYFTIAFFVAEEFDCLVKDLIVAKQVLSATSLIVITADDFILDIRTDEVALAQKFTF